MGGRWCVFDYHQHQPSTAFQDSPEILSIKHKLAPSILNILNSTSSTRLPTKTNTFKSLLPPPTNTTYQPPTPTQTNILTTTNNSP